ncbi:hypothetical protein Tsubulata_021190 [Turnera subulata]|uniref:Uncharacterized protein n=1 Tax=Turnera subulata TaxID=218843 RepID=A0A9Q0JP06_9ROSI|nr:hypothetical protein Tsubulata_021190 [Turnera subulata]
MRCGEEFGRSGQHTRAYRPSAPSPPPPSSSSPVRGSLPSPSLLQRRPSSPRRRLDRAQLLRRA